MPHLRGRSVRVLIVPCSHCEQAFTIAPHILELDVDFEVEAFDVHVRVLDGAYDEASEDELAAIDDLGPAAEKQHGLAHEVEPRFVRWLERHDFMRDEPEQPEGDEV